MTSAWTPSRDGSSRRRVADSSPAGWRDLPIWEWPPHRASRAAVAVPGAPPIAARDVAALASELHRRLRDAGAGPGDCVVVATRDPVAAVVAAFAALRAGILLDVAPAGAAGGSSVLPDRHRCVLVPPDAEWAYSPTAAAVRVPTLADVTADEAGEAVAPHAGAVVGLGETPRAWPPTSSVGATCTSLGLISDLLGLERGSTVVTVLAPDDAAALGILVGLVQGGCAVLPASSVAQVRQGIADGADHLVVTRATARRLCEAAAADWLRVRSLVAIGPPEPDGLRDLVRSRLGADVLVEYGSAQGVGTIVPPVESGIAGVWSWMRSRPDDVAVTGEDLDLTFGELSLRVQHLAAALASRPVDGAVLAVPERQSDLVVITLGCTRAGRDVLVAPSSLTPDVVAALARQAGVTTVACGAGAGGRADDLAAAVGPGVAVLVAGAPTDGAADPAPVPGTRAAGAVIAVTSGTTGPPKVVRRANAAHSPELAACWHRAIGSRLGIHGRGRHVVSGDLAQPASLFFALTALHAGQTLHLMKRWNPKEAAALLTSRDIASAFLVPSKMATVLAAAPPPRDVPAGLTSLVHGTTSCPQDVKRAMIEWLGPVLYDVYSPSEVPGTYATSEEWLAHPGTVGRPFPGVDLAVANDRGEPCGPGETGRVYLSDSGFHYGDRSAVHARLRGMVSVGDVGYLEDGYLFLVGRETDYINVGGAKYHPQEVEAVVGSLAGVADCAVVGVPDRRMGQLPVAFVVPDAGADPRSLRRAVLRDTRRALPITKVPVRVILVPDLPRDGYGKLRRRQLADVAMTTDE